MSVNPNPLMPLPTAYQQTAVQADPSAVNAADGSNAQGQGLIRRVKEGIHICGGPM